MSKHHNKGLTFSQINLYTMRNQSTPSGNPKIGEEALKVAVSYYDPETGIGFPNTFNTALEYDEVSLDKVDEE